MVNRRDKIAVIMGGPSAEAEVSRNTGRAITEALQGKGYNVIPMELHPMTLVDDLKKNHIEVVFNALHGLYGEDGRLQSVLDFLQIPYTGSRVLGSAVSMDKSVTKRIFAAENIPTPRFVIFDKLCGLNRIDIMRKIVSEFSVPLVIKAASQGSSIGVEIVRDVENVPEALGTCFSYCDNIVVEEFINGKELTCGVVENHGEILPLPVIWIEPHSGAYDYHSKYTKGATNYHCPAPLSKELTDKVQKLAVKVFRILGLSAIARVDVMMDAGENLFVLEANTMPGMTATSLVPQMAKAMGMEFADLCEMILSNAK